MKIRPTLVQIAYDLEYIEDLRENDKRGDFKAMAFLFYLHNIGINEYKSSQYYSTVWGTSKTTAWLWLKEFDKAIYRN